MFFGLIRLSVLLPCWSWKRREFDWRRRCTCDWSLDLSKEKKLSQQFHPNILRNFTQLTAGTRKHAPAHTHTHTHTHTMGTFSPHTVSSIFRLSQTHTHTHTHTRVRARTHMCTHIYSYSITPAIRGPGKLAKRNAVCECETKWALVNACQRFVSAPRVCSEASDSVQYFFHFFSFRKYCTTKIITRDLVRFVS